MRHYPEKQKNILKENIMNKEIVKLATKQKTCMIFVLALIASSISFASIDGGQSSQPNSGGSGGAPIDGSHGSSGSSGGGDGGCGEIQIECEGTNRERFGSPGADVRILACSGAIWLSVHDNNPVSGTLSANSNSSEYAILNTWRGLSRFGGDIFKLPKSLSNLSFSVSKVISTSPVGSLNNEDFEISSTKIKLIDNGKKITGTFSMLSKNRHNKLFYNTQTNLKCSARFGNDLVRNRYQP